jgi:hypothetical protein
VTDEQTKKERTPEEREAIKRNAERIYDTLKGAGFNRDSFIELGESVKAEKSFRELHPAVVYPLMRIAANYVPIPVAPVASVKVEPPKESLAKEPQPESSTSKGKKAASAD